MTAVRRLMTDYPLDRLPPRSALPASECAREIAPGVVRLAVSASRQTPDGLSSLGDVLVQVGESSVLRSDVVVGQHYPATERSPDAIEDVFAEEPARLAWLGKLICLMTAVMTATSVWALVA
jgi:hypothetical protein